MAKVIYRKGRKYYLYGRFRTYKKASSVGRYYKKKENIFWYVLPEEVNYWFPRKVYSLYLSDILVCT